MWLGLVWLGFLNKAKFKARLRRANSFGLQERKEIHFRCVSGCGRGLGLGFLVGSFRRFLNSQLTAATEATFQALDAWREEGQHER